MLINRSLAVLWGALAVWVLCRSASAMAAAEQACALFMQAVLPGLFPYMTLVRLLTGRLHPPLPPWLVVLLGWAGGSPGGAALIAQSPAMAQPRRTAVLCATMSPMFLLGTLGKWLNSPLAGGCVLVSVLMGAVVTGLCAVRREDQPMPSLSGKPLSPMTFGLAVEQSARSMLVICGTMVMARVMLTLLIEALPTDWAWVEVAASVCLEATTGAMRICELALPLPLRTAMLSGACGFGGMAILLQNRALLPQGLMPPVKQAGYQVMHGVISFLIGLGLAEMMM